MAKFRRRRGGFKRKRGGKGRLGPRQVRQVKRIVNSSQETKFYDISSSGASVSSTGTITSLTSIAQGTTDITRVGDSISLMRMMWSGVLTVGDQFNIVRVILFQWKPNDNVAPALADLLLNGPSGSPDVYSFYNHDLRGQFHIMSDRTYSLIGNGTSSSIPFQPKTQILIAHNKGLSVGLKKVQYQGGTTVGTHKIYVLTLSDSSAVAHPIITYNARIYYKDS